MNLVKLDILANGRLMICFPKKEKTAHQVLKVVLTKTPKDSYISEGGFLVYVIGPKKVKNKKNGDKK